MIRSSLRARYEDDSGAVSDASVAIDAGDVELKAQSTITSGPSFKDLSLSVQKPGSFAIDYNVQKKDVRFQFMDSVRVLKKRLDLRYSHWRGHNRTELDGTLVIDSANKLSANYVVGSRDCKVKYSYKPKELVTIEPSYDFGKNSWDFAVSGRVSDDDVVKASYQSSSKVLGLDWEKKTSMNGSFKVSASVNLTDPSKTPTFRAESNMNFDM